MLRYLLDTNILSEACKPQPDTKVLDKLTQNNKVSGLAAQTFYELQRGVLLLAAGRRRDYIAHYIEGIQATLPILPYDETAACWQATETVRLKSLGITPSFVDMQIAAVAVVNGLILVTRNTQDFQHFNDLSLENWFN
jgi:tRNA(fMet)-specific endonuclease VapC